MTRSTGVMAVAVYAQCGKLAPPEYSRTEVDAIAPELRSEIAKGTEGGGGRRKGMWPRPELNRRPGLNAAIPAVDREGVCCDAALRRQYAQVEIPMFDSRNIRLSLSP